MTHLGSFPLFAIELPRDHSHWSQEDGGDGGCAGGWRTVGEVSDGVERGRECGVTYTERAGGFP